MNRESSADRLKKYYWPLIKSRQTFLLTFTGAAGYLCHPDAPFSWLSFSGLVGSLLLSISGCTVLNMVIDRDIDRKMARTSGRPLAAGLVTPQTAAIIGLVFIAIGLTWSAVLSWLYFLVILAGITTDLVVYTLWLKRRSAWSIVLGGVAGGMPILAGYTLARGEPDLVGLLLTLVIISWIPGHNLTLSTLYSADYLNAGIPTFTSAYGLAITLPVVFFSNLFTSILLITAFSMLHPSILITALLILLTTGLIVLSLFAWIRPSQKMISFQYKYSSIYMLVAMILLALNGKSAL